MINKIQILNEKLPTYNKEFVFRPTLNILYGPIGSGKSTLLKAIADYCFCDGWTRHPKPHEARSGYPSCLIERSKAKVDWDGSPTYYAPTLNEEVVPHAFDDNRMLEQIKIMVAKPSAGQLRMYNLNKPIQRPKLNVISATLNDVWRECAQGFVDYINTLSQTGPVTVLFDEPDRSLSLGEQHGLWSITMPKWAMKAQIIVASHSVFCLEHPVIELEQGYAAKCRNLIKGSF